MVKHFIYFFAKTTYVISVVLCLSSHAHAAPIAWDYQWQLAAEVDSVPMLPVTADVISATQQQLSLSLPFPVILTQLFVNSGEQITTGQRLLQIRGSEILSLKERLEIAEHHAEAASKRLKDNQKRFDQGDVIREMWLEWQHQAHQTELELKTLQQHMSLLEQWQVKTESAGLTLFAPVSGTVSYSPGFSLGRQLNSDEPVLIIASEDSLQLEFNLPLQVIPTAIKFANCELKVVWKSQEVSFQRRHWRSEHLAADCLAALGQKIVVQPIVTDKAFKVLRKSLIQTDKSDGVIVDPNKPMIVGVQVLAREGDWIYVHGDLTGRSIATADVAALKGYLMGLGAEE